MAKRADILLLDDEEELRNAVGKILAKEGYRVVDAAEPRADVIVHGLPHVKLGSTSRPNSSMASCISGTLLATKSIPEKVVTPAAW